MELYINQKRVRLSPRSTIGKGGEADVFQLDDHQALKVFKPPGHPDFTGQPQAQHAAHDRLEEHQQKLRQFPTPLPERVIQPHALATDRQGQRILGYTMPLLKDTDPLLRYGDRTFRRAIDPHAVVKIFLDLHQTLTQLHQAHVVIGDFNDLNVLIKGTAAYIIDADSLQFGPFHCSMFTARFVDPLRCDPHGPILQLNQPHTTTSDWYAFTVMLMQCLLFVDPYGGVYKPKDKSQQVPQHLRPLQRITIFHPEVRYPKPALPLHSLPHALLHHFQRVFDQDWRGVFPRSLLEGLRWSTCKTCGLDHARPHCPQCSQATVTAYLGQSHSGQGQTATSTTAPPTTETIHGTVTAIPILHTDGVIVQVTLHQGSLGWLLWHQHQFVRDDGSVVLAGALTPHQRWRIQGKLTWLGQQGQAIAIEQGHLQHRRAVDTWDGVVQFDTSDRHHYWIHQGHLHRDHSLTAGEQGRGEQGSIIMGAVLAGDHTQLWVGNAFGIGLGHASTLTGAFVFDAERPGFNDRVALPHWQGTLVQASCTFTPTASRPAARGWLFLCAQVQGVLHYHCIVLAASGTVLATAHSQAGADHWLARLGDAKTVLQANHPGCAVGDILLMPTDEGIIRIDLHHGQLVHRKSFPDTEPFVSAGDRLLPAPSGVYVVSPQRIQTLVLTQNPA